MYTDRLPEWLIWFGLNPYGFDTPKKVQKCKDCGKILPEVKIDCAISAANSRLRARANEWLFYSRLWGLRSRVTTSRVPEDRFALSFPFHFAFI